MNTQVNFRTNKRILSRADKIFEKMGLDRSTALNMFLNRVEAEQGLPFQPTINAKKIRERWDREVENAKKGKAYNTAREAIEAALR